MDYYDRKLEKGWIFKQVDEQSSFEDEAQVLWFSSMLVQRAKSDAKGHGTKESRLLPHNSCSYPETER